MKKVNYLRYLVLILFIVFASVVFAQDGPGDPGGSPESGDNDPIGGRAPVSGGSALLIAIATVYGAKKVYELRNPSQEKTE